MENLQLLGNTPLVKLNNFFNVGVYAKLEFYNPTFSVKDRAAYYMIAGAFEKGEIKKGDIIIEATSGNTGLGLCYAAVHFGLKMICLVFEGVPIEKINLLKAYGAVVLVCETKFEANSKNGYVGIAKMLSEELEGVYYIDQFNNENNILAHYMTTGPEIWKQMEGKVDYFFSAIGTGGTISGIGKFLKENNPEVKVIGVEPVGGLHKSYYYGEKGVYKPHIIPSLSDDFVSPNFKKEYVDDVLQIEGVEAFQTCYDVLRSEGINVGTSGGCTIKAIKDYIQDNNINQDESIVCIMPDSGLKYMDTLFNKKYLEDHKIDVPGLSIKEKELLKLIKKACKDKGVVSIKDWGE